MISIIIPVYKEAENIVKTFGKINEVLTNADIDYEIILVDDNSCDGTIEICQRLSKKLPLTLIVRKKNKGLANSVVEGLHHVKGDIIVIMDADLSHPPEAITEMKQILDDRMADFVVGSRYIAGGSIDQKWPFLRRLNSIAATIPALLLLKIKDPMAGFLSFRHSDLPALSTLSPIGYKIGLEIMVKGRFKKIKEIPIHFSARQLGQSKMNLKEQLLYLIHLMRLYQFAYPRIFQFFLFAAVGFSGMIVDLCVYYGLKNIFNVGHILSRAISFWPAVTWNWALHRSITFNERRKTTKRFQWIKFSLSSLLSFTLNWGIYTFLTQTVTFFQTHLFFAFISGIIAAAGFNFIFSNYLVFPNLDSDRNTND